LPLTRIPPPPPLLYFCRDVLQAIKAIWVNEGFSGFYCGYSLQVKSLILINQKVSCGLKLDLHVGLSKSLEISAKLLIWLTDSECRWAETSLTQPCSSWHLRCWNDSIWMLKCRGGGKKGWKALLTIFGWVQYVSLSLPCYLSLSLSVVALLTKLYSSCMAARLQEVSLGQDVSFRY
jgi:hypothetical protein